MSDPPPPESAPSPATPVDTTSTDTPIPPTLQPTQPQTRYPPFPPIPEGVTILSFSQFREHGIQIFTDPETGVEIDGLGIPTVRLRVPHDTDVRKTRPPPGSKANTNTNANGEDEEEGDGEGEEEGDGSNVKDGKRKKKKKRTGEKGKNKEQMDYRTIKDPIERAQEQRRQRLLLFTKKDWWDQWAEGEDLRKGRIYDTNLTPTDRIHMAATEFRVGRMWPPSSSRLRYLWDQFRLFVGLLGSTPVWIRTDLPQQDDEEDDEESDLDSSPPPAVQAGINIKGYAGENPKEREANVGSATGNSAQNQRRKVTVESDSEDEFAQARYSDEEELELEEASQDEKEAEDSTKPAPQKRKRIPPRPPYALYNLRPIPISSPAHIPILLSLASTQRQTKLLSFLSSPSLQTRVFLSSYIHLQGLIYSPLYLTSLPRLVLFFLEFLVRVRALPELGRELRAACQIARKAVEEVPRTGWVCRNFPDVMGRGARGIWGVRWVQEGWVWDESLGLGPRNGDEGEETKKETEEEAMRRFEDELRAANVQLMPADPVDLGLPPDDSSTSLSSVEEEDENADDDDVPENIRIEIMSPTSPGYVEPDSTVGGGRSGYIEEVLDERDVPAEATSKPNSNEHKILTPSEEQDKEAVHTEETRENASPAEPSVEQPITTPTHTPDAPNWAIAPDDPPSPPPPQPPTTHTLPTDWSSPNGPSHPTPAQQEAAREAWFHPPEQPLLSILGPMSVFPLCFEPGGKQAKVGVAERSMRRVKEVLRAGEEKGKERERGVRMRGVEEDLVDKFARVTLGPWIDWDDAGCAGEYRVPKVQGPGALPAAEIEDQDGGGEPEDDEQAHELREIKRRREKYAHDAFKDDITLLVEPRVAENIGVGMGLAGTWVQLVPVMNPFDEGPKPGGGGGRGRGRGGRGGGGPQRGGGRGRGRGRGGTPGQGDNAQAQEQKKEQQQPRSPTFWYVEEIYMAVPSFWTVGEPEEDLGKALADVLAERGEGGEDVDIVGNFRNALLDLLCHTKPLHMLPAIERPIFCRIL